MTAVAPAPPDRPKTAAAIIPVIVGLIVVVVLVVAFVALRGGDDTTLLSGKASGAEWKVIVDGDCVKAISGDGEKGACDFSGNRVELSTFKLSDGSWVVYGSAPADVEAIEVESGGDTAEAKTKDVDGWDGRAFAVHAPAEPTAILADGEPVDVPPPPP